MLNICMIIVLIICIIDIIGDIFEYFYKKYHDWNNDIGYQQWLSIHKDIDDDIRQNNNLSNEE